MKILEKMKLSEKKCINIYFNDGNILENVYCDMFHWSQDEDEENMLEIGVYLINESEIKDIEILNN